MCITIEIGESTRKFFGLMTFAFHIILFFMCITLVVSAIAIRMKLDQRLELLEGYNAGSFPYFLMTAAAILFFVHLIGAKISFESSYPDTRMEKNYLFVAYLVVLLVITVFVFICQIVCWVHMAKIRGALREGILRSMKGYKGNMDAKLRIDNLQLEFACCGVDEYADWFKMSWVSLAYVNIESNEVKPYLKDGDFIKDDAPFSCCSVDSARSCIHHSVKSRTAHTEYTELTLNTEGCVHVVARHFDSHVMTPTGILLLVIFIIEVTVLILMRLLQTSILSAEESDDPEGPGEAYCIKGVGGGRGNEGYFRKKGRGGDSDDEESGRSGGGGGGGIGGFFSRLKNKISGKGSDDDDDDDGGSGKKKKKDKGKKGKDKKKGKKGKDAKKKGKGKDGKGKGKKKKGGLGGKKKKSPKAKKKKMKKPKKPKMKKSKAKKGKKKR